ncbi:MAG: TonB-dependent receptor, partial [Gemmatimonadaceae bacterium]
AQLTLTRGHWSVQPGLRVSWSEAWGESVTPRVAALYRPAPRLALRASLGRGFRAPDFKELYIDFVHAAAGYAVRGNPELRPESSVNGSAGVEWAGSSVYARATVFHNRFSDFIETRETESPGTFSYGNVASGRTQGIELDAGLVAGRARLEGGYAYLRSRDDATGRSLLGPAPHSARLAAGYQIASGLRAKLTGLFTGAAPTRRDASGAVTSERDDFLRFDLNVQQQLPRALALTFGVDNLLDEEPGADWPGFAGRMIYVGLTWQSSSALQ